MSGNLNRGVATQSVADSVGSDEFKSGCGAVGSVLRSGRRGRKFESSHPDNKHYKHLHHLFDEGVFVKLRD